MVWSWSICVLLSFTSVFSSWGLAIPILLLNFPPPESLAISFTQSLKISHSHRWSLIWSSICHFSRHYQSKVYTEHLNKRSFRAACPSVCLRVTTFWLGSMDAAEILYVYLIMRATTIEVVNFGRGEDGNFCSKNVSSSWSGLLSKTFYFFFFLYLIMEGFIYLYIQFEDTLSLQSWEKVKKLGMWEEEKKELWKVWKLGNLVLSKGLH